MNNKLIYNRPAAYWEEALPLGNGRLGAMVYGGYEHDVVSLNFDTFWSGTVRNDNQKNSPEDLKKMQELIVNGDYKEANNLAQKLFVGYSDAGAYLPAGDLTLTMYEHDNNRMESFVLDMENGTVTEKFGKLCGSFGEQPPKYHTRNMYISYPHDVMIIDINACSPVSYCIGFENSFVKTITEYENGIGVICKAPTSTNHGIVYDGSKTVSFGLVIKAYSDCGTVTAENGIIEIKDANKITVVVSGETNFVSYDKYPDESKDLLSVCDLKIQRAVSDGFDKVFEEHIKDYKELYNRVKLDICESDDTPADKKRLDYIDGKHDDSLVELMFNYGRYLMIAGSRKGTQPTNLQGIWNRKIAPPWFSDYTTNINTEMNYWAAESCNLSECHEPLFKMIEELCKAGERTAKDMYDCSGTVCHHNTDLWRMTTPATGSVRWASWPMAIGWMAQHLWQHYEYTLDESFFRDTAYPIIKKASEFYLDLMIKDKDGYDINYVSISPENAYLLDGEVCFAAKMSTMDRSIIGELLGNLIKISDVLGISDEVVEKAKKVNLSPFKVGSEGQLLEWCEEFEETEKGHRHVSHLYGVYPGDLLHGNDELMNAARRSLELRLANGGGHTGWSCGWIICLFAAFKDGENAKKYIDKLITDSTYPNLFDAHPPFQIDGNFAFTAGVAHMLLQSRKDGEEYIIEALPAIPKSWKKGSVKGLRAKGGFEVDIDWDGDKVDVNVKNLKGNKYRVIG